MSRLAKIALVLLAVGVAYFLSIIILETYATVTVEWLKSAKYNRVAELSQNQPGGLLVISIIATTLQLGVFISTWFVLKKIFKPRSAKKEDSPLTEQCSIR